MAAARAHNGGTPELVQAVHLHRRNLMEMLPNWVGQCATTPLAFRRSRWQYEPLKVSSSTKSQLPGVYIPVCVA